MKKKKLTTIISRGQASPPVAPLTNHAAQAGTPELPGENLVSTFTCTQRNLPHWQNPGSLYFITFKTYNRLMLGDRAKNILYESILFHDKSKYNVFCFVIMDDHVHIILQACEVDITARLV
jgi:hypothetical protein